MTGMMLGSWLEQGKKMKIDINDHLKSDDIYELLELLVQLGVFDGYVAYQVWVESFSLEAKGKL